MSNSTSVLAEAGGGDEVNVQPNYCKTCLEGVDVDALLLVTAGKARVIAADVRPCMGFV